MAKATYFQRGETLDYENTGGTTIEAGTILVLGARVGVAGCDIAAGEVGTVHVEGCYWFDLAATASGNLAQGTKIYIDGSQKATIEEAGNTLAGFAAAPVAIGDTRVLIKLNAADSNLETINVGDGLLSEAEVVSVNVDDSTIEIDSVTGKVQVKDEGITAAKLNADVAGAGLTLNAETNAIDIVPAANQAASEASQLTNLVTDFNTLLAALKAAGFMAADAGGD